MRQDQTKKATEPKTDVIFRKYRKAGDIIAIFPAIPATTFGDCMSYQHTEQHRSCDTKHVLFVTVGATEAEYKDLYTELTVQVGYNLRVVQAITAKHRKAIREAIKQVQAHEKPPVEKEDRAEKSTHTPGPWVLKPTEGKDPLNQQITVQQDGETIIIGDVRTWCMDAAAEGQANAALIAAAPDTLAALRTVTEYLSEAHATDKEADHYGDPAEGCTYCQAIQAAEAAIAKAEGRA
jgi:hypothetical protein